MHEKRMQLIGGGLAKRFAATKEKMEREEAEAGAQTQLTKKLTSMFKTKHDQYGELEEEDDMDFEAPPAEEGKIQPRHSNQIRPPSSSNVFGGQSFRVKGEVERLNTIEDELAAFKNRHPDPSKLTPQE